MKLSISKNVEDHLWTRSINGKGSMIPINSYSNNLSKQRCDIAGYSWKPGGCTGRGSRSFIEYILIANILKDPYSY